LLPAEFSDWLPNLFPYENKFKVANDCLRYGIDGSLLVSLFNIPNLLAAAPSGGFEKFGLLIIMAPSEIFFSSIY